MIRNRFHLSVLCILSASSFLATAQTVRAGDKQPEILASQPALDLSQIEVLRRGVHSSLEEEGRSERYDTGSSPLYSPSTNVEEHVIIHANRAGYPLVPALLKADIIAVGVLEKSAPHISKSGAMIYSTFDLRIEKVLKAPSDIHNAGILHLERIGGVASYPSGRRELIGVSGEGLPIVGKKYLIFANLAEQKGTSYRLDWAYQIQERKIYSLDKVGDEFNGADISKFVANLQSMLKASDQQVAR